ncbi:hypothetical protein WN51_06655 [Melipona quadrifasciata]|uniref:Uncharacterized protein n=1 Tax=Melipona quadrifasciata TaxID=166423 RepID=A0A0M9ABD8_9HYME|nr:hypothetical protein WN51_06655 [Melipona quadrifasciata]
MVESVGNTCMNFTMRNEQARVPCQTFIELGFTERVNFCQIHEIHGVSCSGQLAPQQPVFVAGADDDSLEQTRMISSGFHHNVINLIVYNL